MGVEELPQKWTDFGQCIGGAADRSGYDNASVQGDLNCHVGVAELADALA